MKRLTLGLITCVLLATAACGDGDGPSANVELLAGPNRAEPSSSADVAIAGEAITAFGTDLFAAVRALPASSGENVIVSPASVAIALAMVEPGAVDDGLAALDELLRIDDPAAFHASMNALEQELEARVAPPANSDEEDPGELTLSIANAAYLQEGYPFEQPYIDTVSESYGPVLNAVDFAADPDAVAHDINDFVAEETRDRITDLVPDGALSTDTVFALVNALYLKASWLEVFEADDTEDGPFTLLDGSEVDVPLMHGGSGSSARGDGWVGASKPYVGGLVAQFVLPDEGRFDEVATDLDAVFAAFEAGTGGAELVVPRFETRFHIDLPDALRALGLGPLFEPGRLTGIAPDERLKLDQAIHETYVAVDEEGTEAAAATVLSFEATGAPIEPPPPVILDRPFLFRILDTETGTTLFLGQVLDPTLGA